jgi:aarF domain-containing kinase
MRLISKKVLGAVGGIGGTVLCLGVADEYCWYNVIERSLRALGVGAYAVYSYKVNWTAEKAHSINAAVAEALTDCCLRNEGLYVKIGQSLNSMAVVLPPEYVSSLSRCLDRAKSYDIDVVNRVLQEELGDNYGELLRDLDPVPVGSASLAQVHKAIYIPTGETVAVKIQKPNVSLQSAWDLRLYRFVMHVLEWTFDLPLTWSVDFIVRHFEAELDFRLEAANSELCREDIAKNEKLKKSVYIPRVIQSRQRVLITEWVDDAVLISNVSGIKQKGLDCKSVIMDATGIFAYQIFKTGHVHCDPHPGNLLVRVHPNMPRQHQIVLIDHGLYVKMPDSLRRDYARLWVAMAPPRDVAVLQEICHSWGIGSVGMFETMVKSSSRNNTEIGSDELKETLKLGDLKKKNAAEMNATLKDAYRKLLSDTSKFPKELMLVGRCLNYIRAANWTHGSPIDRVSVLANAAREALHEHPEEVTDYPSYFNLRNWMIYLFSTVMSYLPGGEAYDRHVEELP